MEIQKIFSDEYDEECLYSVLMTEEELNFLQREFAFKDYADLSDEAVEMVKKGRSKIAQDLARQRKEIAARNINDPEFLNLERDLALQSSGIRANIVREKAKDLDKAKKAEDLIDKLKKQRENHKQMFEESAERIHQRIKESSENFERELEKDLKRQQRLQKSKESIAHHKRVADGLRRKRTLKRVGAATAVAIPVSAAIGYGVYKSKKKKKD